MSTDKELPADARVSSAAVSGEHAERECLSCGAMGHWYLHCPKHPFWPMVGKAFGLPPLLFETPPPSGMGEKEGW